MTQRKFQPDTLVRVSPSNQVGNIETFDIDEDHEKYYVNTGNSLTSKWYDVTDLREIHLKEFA